MLSLSLCQPTLRSTNPLSASEIIPAGRSVSCTAQERSEQEAHLMSAARSAFDLAMTACPVLWRVK